MPKRDPDQPPPDACPLGEAFRRFADPELAAALDAAEAAYAAAESRIAEAETRAKARRRTFDYWYRVDREAEGEWLPRVRSNRTPSPPLPDEVVTRLRMRHQIIVDGWARLGAGEWIAWGREGTPTGPWRRLPAETWAILQPCGDMRLGGVVRVKGSEIRYYGVVVCRAAAQPRVPSIAAVGAALLAAEAEKGKPLTVREVDAIAREMGAPRALARDVRDELRCPGG